MAEPTPQENIPILLKDTDTGKVLEIPKGLTPEQTQGLSSGKYSQVFDKPVNDNTQLDAPARELNTLYDTTNGQVVRLPLDKIPQAIADGSVGFKKGERINMLNQAGESINLPSENVQAALAQGYALEHPNQIAAREYAADNQGISGTLKVGLSQFADEALMGLPEIIYDHTADPLQVAKKEALKNQHQIANTFGGIAGFGASLLYGGELVKGATVAGRIAEKAVLGAAEHGAEKLIIEGGEKLAEQGIKALTIKGVDAESIKLAETSLKAFEDATIKNVEQKLIANGTAEGAAKVAAPGIARRLIASTVKYGVEGAVLASPQAATEEMLGDHKAAAESLVFGIGGGAALGITGGMGKEFLNLTKKTMEYIPDAIPQIQKMVGEKLSPEAMRLSAIGAKTSDLNKAGVDRLMGATKELADQGVFSFEKGIDGLPTFKKITERLEGINKVSGERIGEIFSNLDERMAANPMIAQDAFNPGALAKKIEDHFLQIWGIDTPAGRVIDPVRKAEFKDVNKWIKSLEMRGENPITFEEARKIKNTISEQTKWDHTVNNSTNWNRQEIYNQIRNELDQSVDRVGKRIGDESLLNDYIKLKQDWGNSSELLRVVDKEKARQIGNRLVGLTDTITGAGLASSALSSVFSGHLLHALYPIMGIGIKKALETSVAKSLAAKGMEKAGLLFTEQAMKRVAQRIDEIPEKLAGTVKTPTELGVSGLARFLGRDAEGKDKYEQFKAIQTKLTDFQINPDNSANRLGKLAAPITNGAPKISEEYISQMANLYNYLYAKMPKNQQDQMPFKKVEWKPSDADIGKFSKVLMTVDNPFTVIDDLMNGTVTKDQVETLKVVYPSIHAAMINKINDLAASEKTAPQLNYQTRIKLSLLMGVNFDPSLANVTALQNNFIPPAKSGGSGSKVDIVTSKSNPLMTPTQMLANRK